MKLLAHLGVRNEVELIERCIAHLWQIGVDHIVVCDMYSTDGTAEILKQHKSERFEVVNVAISEPGEVWLRRNEEAVKRTDADWILFVDGDEFPLPATGSIKDCAAMKHSDLVTVRRYNVPLCRGRPLIGSELRPESYPDVHLIVTAPPDFRSRLETTADLPLIRVVPGPKVMVRRTKLGAMTEGMHNLQGDYCRATAEDLIIAHLPVTTRERFRRRVRDFRETLIYQGDYLGRDGAWHWRWLVSLDDLGKIDGEFERSNLSDGELADLCSKQVIRTAAEVLNKNCCCADLRPK